MKYLDIVVEDVERINEGRRNINTGATVIFLTFIFSIFVFYFINDILFFGVISILCLVILCGLMIKREIYSLAILIKKQQEE